MCWLCVGQGMLIRARGGFGSTTHRIPPPVAQQERDLAIEARGVGEGRPRESQMASLGALVATRRCYCCYDVIFWECAQFCCELMGTVAGTRSACAHVQNRVNFSGKIFSVGEFH